MVVELIGYEARMAQLFIDKYEETLANRQLTKEDIYTPQENTIIFALRRAKTHGFDISNEELRFKELAKTHRGIEIKL